MIHINQIDLISAICGHLGRKHGKNFGGNARQMNSIIQAATDIVNAFAEEHKPAVAGMGLARWLCSDDTGLSSRFMVRVLHHNNFRTGDDIHWPHDPSDFGRCLRLLEAAPELREKLPMLASTSPQWKSIVENWAELESLYREEFPTGEAPKLYARMQAIGL